MILSKAVAPRAQESERDQAAESFDKILRELFLRGEDIPSGRSAAEQLSPVAAAHRILTNAFAMIPFGVYRKVGGERPSVDDETRSCSARC